MYTCTWIHLSEWNVKLWNMHLYVFVCSHLNLQFVLMSVSIQKHMNDMNVWNLWMFAKIPKLKNVYDNYKEKKILKNETK